MVQVSVVIPTFGRPDLVRRAVDGALAQTMADLEVIVVIDGHDPATVAALAAVPDPRLRVIVHDTNQGAGCARDTGADAAAGAWVAFLDDDDEWLATKLERQLAAAPAGPAVLMTLSHVVTPLGSFVRPNDPYRGAQPFDEWLFDRRSWLKGGQSFLQTSSLMMPKALFEVLHFRDTKQHEEWELVIRAVKQHGYDVVTVAEPLVVHYDGDARPSLSKTYTWKRSLDWIESMHGIVTPRAYAGFCLTVVARTAALFGDRSAMLPLLRAARRGGRPSAKQLLAFALIWGIPDRLRRKIRATAAGGTPTS